MPRVTTIGPLVFFFYSNESSEPRHIHVRDGNKTAKFWLEPEVRLERSGRFKPHELTELARLVEQHRREFTEAWNEHFSDQE